MIERLFICTTDNKVWMDKQEQSLCPECKGDSKAVGWIQTNDEQASQNEDSDNS